MARGGLPFSPVRDPNPRPSGKLTFAFGSCRVSIRHEEPCTLKKSEDRHGHGRDTLYALAIRMKRQPEENWPDALLLLGDQVYADEASPVTRDFTRSRRNLTKPPVWTWRTSRSTRACTGIPGRTRR